MSERDMTIPDWWAREDRENARRLEGAWAKARRDQEQAER